MSVDLTLKQGSNLPLKQGWWGGGGLTGVSLTNPLPENPGRNAAPHPNGLAVGLLRETEERGQDIREREREEGRQKRCGKKKKKEREERKWVERRNLEDRKTRGWENKGGTKVKIK